MNIVYKNPSVSIYELLRIRRNLCVFITIFGERQPLLFFYEYILSLLDECLKFSFFSSPNSLSNVSGIITLISSITWHVSKLRVSTRLKS